MAPYDLTNGGSVDVFFFFDMVGMVYLQGADAIIGNGYGI